MVRRCVEHGSFDAQQNPIGLQVWEGDGGSIAIQTRVPARSRLHFTNQLNWET